MLSIVITLIVIGVLLWMVTKFIPMEPNIKNILVGVVVIFTILWLLRVLGVFTLIS